jgi:hypothetical protein
MVVSPPPTRFCTTGESSRLQYAMRDRLGQVIETVDDDLGRSAASGVCSIG